MPNRQSRWIAFAGWRAANVIRRRRYLDLIATADDQVPTPAAVKHGRIGAVAGVLFGHVETAPAAGHPTRGNGRTAPRRLRRTRPFRHRHPGRPKVRCAARCCRRERAGGRRTRPRKVCRPQIEVRSSRPLQERTHGKDSAGHGQRQGTKTFKPAKLHRSLAKSVRTVHCHRKEVAAPNKLRLPADLSPAFARDNGRSDTNGECFCRIRLQSRNPVSPQPPTADRALPRTTSERAGLIRPAPVRRLPAAAAQ